MCLFCAFCVLNNCKVGAIMIAVFGILPTAIQPMEAQKKCTWVLAWSFSAIHNRNGDVKDKRILLIGANYSAEDIALTCHKFGSKEIHVAYNSRPMGYGPIAEHPPVAHFEGERTACFIDGTKIDFDMVILTLEMNDLCIHLQYRTSNLIWC